MDHEIFVSADGSYIALRIIGKTGRHRMAQVEEAHALGAQRDIHRFLVDLRDAVNVESPVQDYRMAYTDFPAAPQVDLHARVAALTVPGDHSHDFLVTVFRNSGAWIEQFDDLEMAEAYLRG